LAILLAYAIIFNDEEEVSDVRGGKNLFW